MGAMASQVTSLTILYSTVYSGADQTPKLRITGLCVGNSPVTGESPTQRANDAGNVTIWWRHHEWSDRCEQMSYRVPVDSVILRKIQMSHSNELDKMI